MQLQILNLSDNNFNHSQIPSQLGHLSSLAYLDLSGSGFSGQVPLGISQLSNLLYLDLSVNDQLVLRPDLSVLVRNLSNLKCLYLSEVDISAHILSFLKNFSSLMSFFLDDYALYGQFRKVIF